MRNVTLRQLRAVKAIRETGKIIKAANMLGLTGPAVTIQLQQLEEELGVTLFERLTEGLRPTAAGLAAIDAAETIDERLRILDDEIEAITKGRRGTLRLGVVSTAKYFAPRLMAGFSRKFPDIQLDLKIGNREEIIRSLGDHHFDIALMGRPPRDLPVNSLIFGDHPLVIIAPVDHPLADRRDIPKQEIAKENFLIREAGSGTRISLEIFFASLPSKLENLGSEMASNETIKQAVMAGMGIGFISAHTVEMELDFGKLVILDVVGTPIRRDWFSVWRTDRVFTPAMQIFNSFLREEGAKYLPLISKPYPMQEV
jgi:LysR family transcriptional regulator, low CO2-responsive transcriptional regulator